MFKESYLISQLREGGDIYHDVSRTPGSSKPDTAPERKNLMPGSPPEKAEALADKMICDVFGKQSLEKVKQEIGGEVLAAVIDDIQKYGALEYKGVFQEYGKVYLVFDDGMREKKMRFGTVFFINEAKLDKLFKLTAAPKPDTRALELRASKYIMGHVVEMILHYGPDDVPDDVLERILKTGLIWDVRKILIESYKRGKPYLVSTSEKGFKLETEDPKDRALPDKDYDMEKFWREIKLTDEVMMSDFEGKNISQTMGKNYDADFEKAMKGKFGNEVNYYEKLVQTYGDPYLNNVFVNPEDRGSFQDAIITSVRGLVEKEPRLKDYYEAYTVVVGRVLDASDKGKCSSLNECIKSDPNISDRLIALRGYTEDLTSQRNKGDAELGAALDIFEKNAEMFEKAILEPAFNEDAE